jgi:hypothetical protein
MKRYQTHFSVTAFFLLLVFSLFIQAAHGAALQKSSFYLPGDGKRNNNRTIGDYCCTGETATVRTPDGNAIGYIYFYDFRESYNIGNNQSVAGILRILVSGISDMWNLNSTRSKHMIEFRAHELKKGASRSVTAGALRYTATILSAKHRTKNHQQYYMGSVKVRMDVGLSGSGAQTSSGSGQVLLSATSTFTILERLLLSATINQLPPSSAF